ncbi:MAG: hypothetical protein JWQ71_2876 [Pedosphaera sp.]|nr:hypothetical protein [Pedosphaera sp.]
MKLPCPATGVVLPVGKQTCFAVPGALRCFLVIHFALLLAWSSPAANTVYLTPINCCDQSIITTNIGGQTVWRNVPGSSSIGFAVPTNTFTYTPSMPVYVEAVYYDEGDGQISLQYDSMSGGAYANSLRHVRTSRVDTRLFVHAYYVLQSPDFRHRQGTGSDLRLSLGGQPPLSVQRCTIQNHPFTNEQFQAVLATPWLQPYSGPTRTDVDNNTLNQKVLAGYQGWFRAPNDLADNGWFHWFKNGSANPTNYNTDMWPDISGFNEDELFPAGTIKTRSGLPAKLFSSTTPKTVSRHFQWMRKYNIDGAFLQRFVSANSGGAFGGDEFALANVRAGAHQEGRIWAIEYDVSSLGTNNALTTISNDWRWLCDMAGVRNDSRYAHENGKPVVFVWGLPFTHNNFTLAAADDIINFFKNDPVYGSNYVIGGWPNTWRSMNTWSNHFKLHDGGLIWQSQSHLQDRQQMTAWNIHYFPHVAPGGSWSHLQKYSSESERDYVPRTGGAFYWQAINDALNSGATRLFVGMFDEYDESTAIMPMTDDPPDHAPNIGRFLTNLGKPSDWWLWLTGVARDVLRGTRVLSATVPTEAEYANFMATNDLAGLPPARRATLLIPSGAIWKYLDTGVAPAANWKSNSFNEAGWKTGAAELGYGDGGETTIINYGGNANNKYITAWFRHSFVVTNPADYFSLVLGIVRDDGAAAYLNGQELYRMNLPAGAISSSTLATNDVNSFDERAFFERNVDSALLVPGTNVLAVEVHQISASSPDLSFDFTLTGLTTEQVRPRLEISSIPSSAKLNWPATTGFFVPFTASNLSAATWTRTTNMTALSNGQWQVTLPLSSGPQWFKLGAP